MNPSMSPKYLDLTQFRYIYHMFWEIDFPWEAGEDDEKISMLYLQELEESIPAGPYIFVMDAGLLGSYQTAQYLHKKGRSFLMSCQLIDQPHYGHI